MSAVTASCDLSHRSRDIPQVSKSIAPCCATRAPSRAHNLFKDIEHLVRLAAVMAIALIAFVTLRALVVPHSFGQYGHYRGDAIAEIAARPVAFAGHDTCEACHVDVVEQKKQGKHVVVPCEACHGAQAQHAGADDPSTVKPVLLDTSILCARCHTTSAAKPKGFPQVVPADHSNGMPCDSCHQPHNPSMDAPAADAPAKPAGGAK